MSTGEQDVEAVAPVAAIEPPKKKKALPFKRTVARKQTPEHSASSGAAADLATAKNNSDDDLDLFRRSKEVFNEVLRKVDEERQASLTPETNSRKRKSPSDDDGPNIRNKRHQSSSSSLERSPTPAQRFSALDDSDDEIVLNKKKKGKETIRTPEIFTPNKPTQRQTPSSAMSSPVVIIDDSDDEGGGAPIGTSSMPTKPRVDATSKSHASSLGSSPIEIISKREINSNHDDDDDDDDDEEEEEKSADEKLDNMDDEWARKAMELRKLTEQDVVIFEVISRFPGTVPMKAKRRLAQSLAIVLETWALKQWHAGISLPPPSEMFATWKGQKIYSHSSLASLGIRLDETGRPRCSPGEEGYFFDEVGLPVGIQLEIWDDQLYMEYLEQKNRERAVKLGISDEDYAAESEGESPEPEPKKRYKVILKAKELEPLKMAVMEDTTVEFMIDAFCQQRDVPNEWDVAIYFDGERLSEDSLVVDADIDPDDTNQFEVHIKK